MDEVRKTYDGSLALARDLMVINVTNENIEVRMAIVDEYVLPSDVTMPHKQAPRSGKKEPSEWTQAGKWPGYKPPPMPKKVRTGTGQRLALPLLFRQDPQLPAA
jgi:ribonuclease Z